MICECAGCGAEQPQGRIRCDQCGKPLVFPKSFVCPRCGAESFNLHDIVHGYCARCHVFVAADAPPADPYRDACYSERPCDHCGKPYRGPAVYCSLTCALSDA